MRKAGFDRTAPRLLNLTGSVLVLLACGCSSRVAPGVRIEVGLEASAKSVCVIVVATSSGVSAESSPVLITQGETKVFAIGQGSLATDFVVEALGYSDTACMLRIAESSGPVAAQFPTSGLAAVSLKVAPIGSSTDGGLDAGAGDGGATGLDGSVADGGPAGDGGAVDAGAHDAGSHDASVPVGDAGNPCRSCSLGPICNGQVCGGAASASAAACNNGVCRELACGNSIDDNGLNGTDCTDPDCAQHSCGTGTCNGSMCTSETNCADGLDNDSNGSADCLDPSCAGLACNDGLACTVNEVCGSLTCASGAPRVCVASPGGCFNASVCVEPSGCQTSVNVGGACDDSLTCTENETCLADAGCGAGANPCTTPPGQCFVAVGACSEGPLCSYAPKSGTCDDGNNCTTNDQCDGGSCAGTPVTCDDSECQVATSSCTVGGACIFNPKTGASCSGGGRCTSVGTCGAAFPFTPSNFDPADMAATDGGNVLTVTCPVVINSTGDNDSVAARVVDGGACLSMVPPWRVADQNGNGNVLLLTLDGLNVQASGQLRFIGTRPVIIAVTGDATVAGSVDVSGGPATLIGAGGRSCNSSSGGNGTGGFNAGRPGGGGAGYGLPGGSGGEAATQAGTPGGGGSQTGSDVLVPLRGGCQGGDGASAGLGVAGQGGASAGAIQLTVSGTLTISGRVSAAGAGGTGGGTNFSGGGGGSSGGGILLEANTVAATASAALTANGGGGGCGCGEFSVGATGPAGSTTSASAAVVGNCGGTTSGGVGGSGGAASAGAGNGGDAREADHGGGGGGGGAVGRIRINSVNPCALSTAVRSPVPASTQASCQ